MFTRSACAAAAVLLLTSTAALAQTAAPPPSAPPATAPTSVPETTAPPSAANGAGGMAPMAATGTAKLSKTDQNFVMKAASGGMAEVQAAQLAQQKSQNPKVKDFASTMITDHTQANQQLTSLAEQKGVTVPTTLDSKDQKQLDKLSKLNGSAFDKAYIKGQIKDHETMIKLFQKEAKSGKDADLKSFADQTVPVLQKHLDMAKADSGAS